MTSLEERATQIIQGVGESFNALPLEERKRINKYLSYMQILTIWQMLNSNEDLTNKRWKDKTKKWLENCVKQHVERWGYE
jgi:hypothetical protein